jgi:hypothetical protein
MSEENGRATTQTIDRRVAKLEDLQAETDRKVDNLDLKVGYMKDMVDLKLTSVQNSVAKIETMIDDAMKQAGDIRSNPLGRQVDDRLVRHGNEIDELTESMNQMKGAYRAAIVLLSIISALAGAASILSLLSQANVI